MSAEYFDKLFIVGLKLRELSSNEKSEILEGITKSLVGVRFSKLKKDKLDISEEFGSRDSENEGESIKPEIIKKEPEPKSNEKGGLKTIYTITNQLSKDENQFLMRHVEELLNATPRKIRNYTIKYRLAREIVKISVQDEFEIYWNLEARDIMAKHILSDLNFNKFSLKTYDKVNVNLRDLIPQAVEMVNYLPK